MFTKRPPSSPFNSSNTRTSPDARGDFFNSFNDLMDNMLNVSFLGLSPVQTDLGNPKINAYRVTNTNLDQAKVCTPGMVVDIFVPYLTKEFLDIDSNEADNTITITARPHQDENISDNDYFVRQLSRSGFKRVFTFDKEHNVSSARAELKDGILRIVIRTTTIQQKTQGKKITIS